MDEVIVYVYHHRAREALELKWVESGACLRLNILRQQMKYVRTLNVGALSIIVS